MQMVQSTYRHDPRMILKCLTAALQMYPNMIQMPLYRNLYVTAKHVDKNLDLRDRDANFMRMRQQSQDEDQQQHNGILRIQGRL